MVIALINFGPNAPTHPQLNAIMKSCGCDSWDHEMIPTEGRTPKQLAEAAAQFAYDVTLEYYIKKATKR